MLEKIIDVHGKPELVNPDKIILVSPNSERRNRYTIYLVGGHEVIITKTEYERLYD